jgi:predicted solute-binding protein
MLTVGRISYINCYPVYGAIDRGILPLDGQIISGIPTALNRQMADGTLDISVVSAVEYARDADRYLLLPDLAISCDGPVRSVMLFSNFPAEELTGKTVVVSKSSMTSVALLELLFEHVWHSKPIFTLGDAELTDIAQFDDQSDARLVIGDAALVLAATGRSDVTGGVEKGYGSATPNSPPPVPSSLPAIIGVTPPNPTQMVAGAAGGRDEGRVARALRSRSSCDPTLVPTADRAGAPRYQYAYDLGETWKQWTGLPFVFAVWVAQRTAKVSEALNVHAQLIESRNWGVQHLDILAEQAHEATGVSRDTCKSYLSGLDYGLSYQHLAGLTEFFRRLVQRGRVPNGTLAFLTAA